MTDDLRGLAAREATTMGKTKIKRRIIRVVRAALPEIFDLKDSLVRACLDGQITAEERDELERQWRAVWLALGQAAVEEVTGE